jgi:hypothetical protein
MSEYLQVSGWSSSRSNAITCRSATPPPSRSRSSSLQATHERPTSSSTTACTTWARAGRRPLRVFKLARRRLEPGRPVTIRREHAFDHVSIRRIHPGRNAIDIQVNGRVLGSAAVEITPAP